MADFSSEEEWQLENSNNSHSNSHNSNPNNNNNNNSNSNNSNNNSIINTSLHQNAQALTAPTTGLAQIAEAAATQAAHVAPPPIPSPGHNPNNAAAAATTIPTAACLYYDRDYRTFPAELLHRFQARPAALGMEYVTVPFLEDWSTEIRDKFQAFLEIPPPTRRSGIWHAFSMISREHPTDGGRGICNFCGMSVNITYGTSVMRSHLFACKNPKGKKFWIEVCDTEGLGRRNRSSGRSRRKSSAKSKTKKEASAEGPDSKRARVADEGGGRASGASALTRMRELESIRQFITEAQFAAKQREILDTI